MIKHIHTPSYKHLQKKKTNNYNSTRSSYSTTFIFKEYQNFVASTEINVPLAPNGLLHDLDAIRRIDTTFKLKRQARGKVFDLILQVRVTPSLSRYLYSICKQNFMKKRIYLNYLLSCIHALYKKVGKQKLPIDVIQIQSQKSAQLTE